MKALTAVLLVSVALTGCSHNPGYTDRDGVYHLSDDAKRDDNLATAGVVAGGLAAAAGIVGLVLATK